MLRAAQRIPMRLIGATLIILVFVFTENFLFWFIRWWTIFLLAPIIIWLIFNAPERSLYFLGVALVIVGSFSNWWCAGDIVSVCARGIDFHIPDAVYSLNNIGVFAVLLSVVTVWSAIYPPSFIARPKLLTSLSSIALVLFAVYLFTNYLLQRAAQIHWIGGIYLSFGFIMVLFGSFSLLAPTLRNQRISKKPNVFLWMLATFIALVPFPIYFLHSAYFHLHYLH
jgi:hypothetical protein